MTILLLEDEESVNQAQVVPRSIDKQTTIAAKLVANPFKVLLDLVIAKYLLNKINIFSLYKFAKAKRFRY